MIPAFFEGTGMKADSVIVIVRQSYDRLSDQVPGGENEEKFSF
jgi:hypothetical protein